MRYVLKRKSVKVDFGKLNEQGISEKVVEKYIPKYVFDPKPLRFGYMKNLLLEIINLSLKIVVELFLTPRKSKKIDTQEVMGVYDREAITYDKHHHLTTRGMDLTWRRQAAHAAINHILSTGGRGRILDLCTGTGLTVSEIVKILILWNLDADIVALDLNSKMLALAEKRLSKIKNMKIDIVRGDVTNLTGKKIVENIAKFERNSFDFVTQVCGIGGVPDSVQALREVLDVLKVNGQFYLSDMHMPIAELYGELPVLFKWWIKMPILDLKCYKEVTIPHVLNRKWAWMDTTPLFYLIRLVTVYHAETSKYYGFRVVSFECQSHRWWMSLPLMPIGKILVEKVKIEEKEAEKREKILEACSF